MNDDELKEYSPTIMGFASSLLDKLGINFIPAGSDTWHSIVPKEDTLTDLKGKPSNDTRTSAERNTDYLNSPYLRWKSSMLNGTNPLVGISRTIVPAAEGALMVTGLRSMPQLFNLVKIAKSTPHGVLNLLINGATLTGVGVTGSLVGEKIDKLLGGDGSIGRFTFGLGSIYGFNKIPFMKDFNQALTRSTVSNSDMDNYIINRGGDKYGFKETSPGNGSLYELGDDVTVVSSPSESGQLIHWKGDPAIEMHLGGSDKPITMSDLKWQRNNFEAAPSGTYISPYSPATSRTLRISLNGITKELLSKNNSLAINRPPTVDGYKTAISSGQHKGYSIDWSDNYYINSFHDYAMPKDTLFRSLYDAFLLNPSISNLNNLNSYLIKIGGKPAKYINGELKIPFPIIYKQ